MKRSTKADPLAPRPNLDFSKGVRGKYANLLKQGSNVVLLDADLLDSFPDSPSVNRALRAFLAISQQLKSAGTRTRTRRPPATASADFDPRVGLRAKVSAR